MAPQFKFDPAATASDSTPMMPTVGSGAVHVQKPYIYLVCGVASVGGLLFGYDLSIIGPALLYLKDAFHLNGAAEGLAMGSAAIGCLFGPWLAVGLSDSWGRQKTLFLAAVLYGLCAAGTAWAGSIAVFDTFRFLGGVGVGLSSVVSPMYIAEIAPARLRGQLVTINNLAIVVGSFAAILVAYSLARSNLADNWRWMFASQIVPVLGLIIGLCFVPNSPRWLAQAGRFSEASEILERVNGKEPAAIELKAIRESLKSDAGTWSDLFRVGTRRAVGIAAGLACLQQLTGASILFAYAPEVLRNAGFIRHTDAIGATVFLQIWNIAATLLAIWMVDRVGRRPLLLVGVIGMGVGLASLGLGFQFGWSAFTLFLLLLLAIGMYLISLAPLAWLIMSEIFPTRLRGKAMALASFVLWASFYLGVQIFPMLRNYFTDHFHNMAGVFYLFAGVSVLAFFFCWKIAQLWQPAPIRAEEKL
jgi:SP family arabinose:H+ symporter-like MFS transporter